MNFCGGLILLVVLEICEEVLDGISVDKVELCRLCVFIFFFNVF